MAVRLFVGNMPYGATEQDLRSHFAAVGDPSHIVIPVDRDTGRPRGFAFVEYMDRGLAEQAVQRFNQQPFMGRSLSVSEARPREERPPGGFRSGPPGAGAPPMPGRNFGPPKKKSASSEKRWDAKERGPKGPIKERYTGRLGGLYDDPSDEPVEPPTDFDDVASRAADDDNDN